VIEADGAPVTLRLTLAALAEIEEAFGAPDLPALAEALATPSAGQLARVLVAMARAAGHPNADGLASADVNLREVMAALTLLFRELLTGEAPGKPSPRRSAGEAG
jgi:hypothetical protein